MSNDLHIDGDFTLNIPHIDGEFVNNEQPDIQADFSIKLTPDKVSQLENDLNYQTQEQVQEAIQAESTVINNRIDTEVERLEEEIQESSNTFVFEQGIPATEWVINHNLNKRPSIDLVDYNGEGFEAYREYTSDNQVIIRLDNAGTGYAYLN